MNDWVVAGRKGGKFLYSLRALRQAWEENKTTLAMSGGFMKFEDYNLKHDYKCLKCETVFEVEYRIGTYHEPKFPCPKCKSVRTRKIITTAPQVRFIGKDFYINRKDDK